VAFTGRVMRGGRPSAGEEVVLVPYRRATGFDPSPSREGPVRTTTGPEGFFRVTVPLRSSSRWVAKAVKPGTDTRPPLATLAGATEKPVWVHAPRPEIEIVRGRAVRGGRTRALVEVTNPLGPDVPLRVNLAVGRRHVTGRFEPGSERLRFVVAGRTGARLQAYVFDPHPNAKLGFVSPTIAAGWSVRLRLAPPPAG
jgi:hypothetical protein